MKIPQGAYPVRCMFCVRALLLMCPLYFVIDDLKQVFTSLCHQP